MTKPKQSSSAKARKSESQPESERILSRLLSLLKGDDGLAAARSEEPPKATDLLTKDHDEVRALFKRHKESESTAERAGIVRKVSRELTMHGHIEEEIFYPALQKSGQRDAVKMVRESLEEHKIVKTLIAELASLAPRDPQFDAKFTVLQESVEHHADEEEDDLFPDAERDLGDHRLHSLGAEMSARKEELKKTLERGEGSKPAKGKPAASAPRKTTNRPRA